MGVRRKRISIRGILTASFLSVAFSLLVILCGLWLINEISGTRNHIERIQRNSLNEQKDHLREKVLSMISVIDGIREYSQNKTEAETQEEILFWLARQRFEYGGYYFVNKPDGTALIFDGKIVTDSINLTDMIDSSGLRLFDIEKKAFKNPEGEFMEYYFKRIDTETPEQKVSFMIGYPDWNWIIGAGNYVADLSKEIEQVKADFKSRLIIEISKIVIVFVLFTVLLFLIATYWSNKLNRNIKYLQSYLRELHETSNTADRRPLPVKEAEELAQEFTDLIKIKNLTEVQLTEALQLAERSSRLNMAFLNNMSHEIRTPLNSIVGFSNLLLDLEISEKDKKRYVDIINNSSEHLLSMVNEILHLSKLESSDQIVLNYRQIDIKEVITEARDFFLPQSKETNIDIILDCQSKDTISVRSDKQKLLQVLTSLISNAFKFTEIGSITLGCKDQGNDVLIFVKDSGIGIDDSELENIFDRFYQVEQGISKRYYGIGLGLSITRKLVSILGGRVWAESKPNEGSTFFITIPKKPQE